MGGAGSCRHHYLAVSIEANLAVIWHGVHDENGSATSRGWIGAVTRELAGSVTSVPSTVQRCCCPFATLTWHPPPPHTPHPCLPWPQGGP